MPKISIIIPVYNVEDYLGHCIDSILNQTYTDFELILVNDGSTDKSGEICDEYAKKDTRIKAIHKENEGVSQARNIGVAAARGEYIGFVDSDDIIEPCMYKLMINVANEYSCDIVQCEHDRENQCTNNESKISDGNLTITTGKKVIEDIYIKKGGQCTNILSLCTKIFKKELFDDITFPYGRVYEDEARIHQLLFKAKRISEINIPLYHYISRDNSIINVISAKKAVDKAIALKERMDFFISKDEAFYNKALHSYFHYLKCIYSDMLGGKIQYKDEDEKIRLMLINEYSTFIKIANMYDRFYLFLLKNNIAKAWIGKNNFEPLQKYIAKLK